MLFGRKNLKKTLSKIRKKKNMQLKEKIGAKFEDSFYKESINLLYSTAYKVINFHKSIANIYKKKSIYAIIHKS